ncbi:hypothetical protein FACS1894211_13320 [Clostridia bacterium]|nr:hypothetical protein FACS1894211_13320 [Clostridia bacterium]
METQYIWDGREIKKTERKSGFWKLFAVQGLAAAVVFLALFTVGRMEASGAQKLYTNIMDAFRYDIPVKDKDDEIGKIKFVDKLNAYREELAAAAPVSFLSPVAAESKESAGGVIDFNDLTGPEVYAAADGTVFKLGTFAGRRYIELRHAGGIVSRCQGLLAAGVHEGERVTAGQLIGGAEGGGTLVFCVFSKGALIASLDFSKEGVLKYS